MMLFERYPITLFSFSEVCLHIAPIIKLQKKFSLGIEDTFYPNFSVFSLSLNVSNMFV